MEAICQKSRPDISASHVADGLRNHHAKQGAAFPSRRRTGKLPRGRRKGRAVRGLEDGAWMGRGSWPNQPSRPIGMGREGRKKERGRGAAAAGGRLLRPEEREGGGSLRSRKEGPPSVCGVSCAFACRRPPLLGKTSKEGRTQLRTRWIKGSIPISTFPRVRDHGGERTGRGGGASAHRVGGAAAQMQHGKSIIA